MQTLAEFMKALTAVLSTGDHKQAFLILRDMRDAGVLADYAALACTSISGLESCIECLDFMDDL